MAVFTAMFHNQGAPIQACFRASVVEGETTTSEVKAIEATGDSSIALDVSIQLRC